MFILLEIADPSIASYSLIDTQVIPMKTSANILDLSPLPAAARREVSDFYQFVMQRYGRIQKKGVVTKKKLPAEFYKPLVVPQYQVVSRDEIYREL